MIKILLVTAVICAAQNDDIDFSGFNFAPKQTFPAQVLPKIMETPLHTSVDKFGKRWYNRNKQELDKNIEEENKKPFILRDIGGRYWQCQDEGILKSFIDLENERLSRELNYYLGIK